MNLYIESMLTLNISAIQRIEQRLIERPETGMDAWTKVRAELKDTLARLLLVDPMVTYGADSFVSRGLSTSTAKDVFEELVKDGVAVRVDGPRYRCLQIVPGTYEAQTDADLDLLERAAICRRWSVYRVSDPKRQAYVLFIPISTP